MRGVGHVLLGACLLAVAGSVSAECPAGGFAYAPAYVGAFKSYGFATDFDDPIDDVRSLAGKTGRICKECPGKPRGIRLVSKREYGGGFLQFPVPVGQSFCASARLDLARMRTSGAFAGLEFDSPAVPIDVLPESYVFVGVADEAGVKTVWVDVSGESVGSELVLPADAQTAVLEIEYAGGAVSVRAGAESDAALTALISSHPFAWGGSGGLGAAAFDLAAGERVGVALEARGDVHGPELQAILTEIGALLALQEGALADLAAEASAEARAKLAEAHARIDPALLGAVGALPAGKAVAKASRELQKAAQKLAAASAGLDPEAPRESAAVARLVEKAGVAERRARSVLETGSPAEAKQAKQAKPPSD